MVDHAVPTNVLMPLLALLAEVLVVIAILLNILSSYFSPHPLV